MDDNNNGTGSWTLFSNGQPALNPISFTYSSRVPGSEILNTDPFNPFSIASCSPTALAVGDQTFTRLE